MEKTVDLLRSSILGIRSCTISAGLVDSVKIPVYGTFMQLSHLANTGRVGNNVFIDPHDPSLVGLISNTLVDSGFGAYVFSKSRILIPIPPPTGDQKRETIAHLQKLGEEAKIAIRNIRKNHRQHLTKDELRTQDKGIQEITDRYIREVSSVIDSKIKSL